MKNDQQVKLQETQLKMISDISKIEICLNDTVDEQYFRNKSRENRLSQTEQQQATEHIGTRCSGNNQGINFCNNQKCTLKPCFVCSQKQCSCMEQHLLCEKNSIKQTFDAIKSKVLNTQQIKTEVKTIIQNAVEQLNQLKQILEEKIDNTISLIELSQVERNFFFLNTKKGFYHNFTGQKLSKMWLLSIRRPEEKKRILSEVLKPIKVLEKNIMNISENVLQQINEAIIKFRTNSSKEENTIQKLSKQQKYKKYKSELQNLNENLGKSQKSSESQRLASLHQQQIKNVSEIFQSKLQEVTKKFQEKFLSFQKKSLKNEVKLLSKIDQNEKKFLKKIKQFEEREQNSRKQQKKQQICIQSLEQNLLKNQLKFQADKKQNNIEFNAIKLVLQKQVLHCSFENKLLTLNSSIVTEIKDLNNLLSFFTKKISKLELKFKARENKFDLNKYYESCGSLENTIIITKNVKSKVIGGFTPFSFLSSENQEKAHLYLKDSSNMSFVFSLTQNEKFSLNENLNAISRWTTKQNITFFNTFAINKQKEGIFRLNEKNYNISSQKYPATKESYLKLTGFEEGDYFQLQQFEVYQVIFQKQQLKDLKPQNQERKA